MGKIIEIPFSENLIRFTAERLMEQDSRDFSSNMVIFSHHRPGHYLHKSMAESLGHSFFLSQIFSMDDFMLYLSTEAQRHKGTKEKQFSPIYSSITEVTEVDRLEACATIVKPMDSIYLLFQVIGSLPDNPWKGLSLNQFIPWGLKLEQVISELDIEMIGDDELCGIEIGEGFQPETWDNIGNHLSHIRQGYHSILKSLNLTTRALTYCIAANNIQDINLNRIKHIYLVGLFAMTRSEKMVVQHLLRQTETTIIRQGDGNRWTPFKEMDEWVGATPCGCPNECCPNDSPEIFLYSASNTHSEVVALMDVLMEGTVGATPRGCPNDSSAIVLPCSEAIIPILSEVMTVLPIDYNISMGYPVIRTPVYALLDMFMGLYKNKVDNTYYLEDYLNLLMHPYIKNIGQPHIENIGQPQGVAPTTRMLVHAVEGVLLDEKKRFIGLDEVQQNSRIFDTASMMNPLVSPLEFREMLTNIHNLFIRGMDGIQTLGQMAGFFEGVLTFLLKRSPASHYPFSSEFFHRFFAFIDEIKASMISSQCFENTLDMLEVFLYFVKDQQVYFEGSPVKGLQILGLLETRCLNFDRIFILDVNEGVLPDANLFCPLLPTPVKRALKMPTYYQREEISKYHFRRLVASSGEVHIIYQETEKMQRSRFVEELVWEKEKSCGRMNVLEAKPVIMNISLAPAHTFTINKTHEMMDVLQTIRFSPTNLNRYLQCPAQFYFSDVLKLKEKEAISDDIDAAEAGNILHRVMEILYSPLVGKEGIRYDHLENSLHEALDETFRQREREIRGEWYLLKEMMFKQIKNYLAWEKEHFVDTRRVISVENSYTFELELLANLQMRRNIRLTGKLDRIDCHDGEYEIIDYKSKNISDLAFKCFDRVLVSRKEMKKMITSLQLPCYVLLYQGANPGIPIKKINSKIISLLLCEEKMLFNDKDNIDRDIFLRDIFLPTLRNLICEIIDPCIPFVADGDEKACKYCAFHVLCRKYTQ
ncbi:PD-(D/E)XK nuclease family protein [Candidatus Desantisbacteria bacterium]|nr:PD-(D/E)XK nuclease family protein [Candidatus Desantisbacteria bacterium]